MLHTWFYNGVCMDGHVGPSFIYPSHCAIQNLDHCSCNHFLEHLNTYLHITDVYYLCKSLNVYRYHLYVEISLFDIVALLLVNLECKLHMHQVKLLNAFLYLLQACV